ncbi:MAG TPA: hypothetical protein VFP65_00485 [Anaeromyxobacteraceae bacterium]|nr:hypothetical protein [Anaeromyxobacteraceae bacterium]
MKRQRCAGCDGQGFHTHTARRTRYDGRPEFVAERLPCGPCCGIGYVLCTGCGGKGRVIR